MLINTVPSMETNLRTVFSLAEIPLSRAQVDTTIIRAESCHRRGGAVVDATNRRCRGQQPSGVALRAQAWHSGPAGNRSLASAWHAHALLKLKIAEAREQVGLRDRAKPGQLSASDFSSYGIPSEPVSL